MRRASSSRARRMPTTSASSICVSSCAGEWRRGLPPVLLFDLLQSRGADVRAYDVARTRALLDELLVGCRAGCLLPTISAGRSRERTRPVRRPDAWSRFAAIVPRVTGTEVSSRCLRAFWEHGTGSLRGDGERARRAAIATRPPLGRPTRAARPARLWTARRCTRRSNRTAPSSLPKSARGEVAPRETTCASTTTRLPRSPTSIEPTRSARARPLARCGAGRERMLDEVDAVVVSLPPDDAVFGWDYPALRDVLEARRIPHVCLRGDRYQALTAAEHAAARRDGVRCVARRRRRHG